MKLTQKATSGKQKPNILSYNPGLKTEFHISCPNLPKTTLDFVFPQTFYPNLPIFLHGYICHICDISQLCDDANNDNAESDCNDIKLCEN